jgi:hypothetical protein
MQCTWNSNTEHGVPWWMVAQLVRDTEQNPPHKHGSTTKPPAVRKLEKHLESLHNVEKLRQGEGPCQCLPRRWGSSVHLKAANMWLKTYRSHRFLKDTTLGPETTFCNSYDVCDIIVVIMWCERQWDRERDTHTHRERGHISIGKLELQSNRINYVKLWRFAHTTN